MHIGWKEKRMSSNKKISILIPCYNEQENVKNMDNAIRQLMEDKLARYEYELVFIDNCSNDLTRKYIREICADNKNVKAIFNVRNFGQNNSPFYGICQTTGDCTISMACDFQDPVELIPEMISKWEEGYKIVSAIKSNSKESHLM